MRPIFPAAALAALLLFAGPVLAQQTEPAAPVEVYRTPPPEMTALVDQPQTPWAALPMLTLLWEQNGVAAALGRPGAGGGAGDDGLSLAS